MTWFANTVLHLIREDWRLCIIYVVMSVAINSNSDLSTVAPRLWFLFIIVKFISFFFIYYLSFKFQRTMLKLNKFPVSPIPDYGLRRYVLRNVGLDFIILVSILPFGIAWLLISPETMKTATNEENRQAIQIPVMTILVILMALFSTRLGNWITVALLPNPPIVTFQWDKKSFRVFLSLFFLLILSGVVVACLRWVFLTVDPAIIWFYQIPLVTILGLVTQTAISILTFAATSIVITQAFVDRVRKVTDASPMPQP